MSSRHALSSKRSMSPAQAREYLKRPPDPGKKQAFLEAIIGCMSEEEADALERRINAMNEQTDEPFCYDS